MIRFVVILYMAGLFYLYASYLNITPYPDDIYFIWEKTTSAGWIVWLLLFMVCKKYRAFPLWAFIVTFIRAIWHIIAFIVLGAWKGKIQPGDDWRITLCFLIVLIGAGFMAFRYKNWFINSLDYHLKRLRL